MNVPLACQTITWGDEQNTRFPEIFQEISDAGFQGVEIGFRHIASLEPETFCSELESHGLKLVASHIGGNLANLSQARGEWEILTKVLDFLNRAGAGLLMLSGIRGRDPEILKQELDFYEKAEADCAARNVSLLYHNHDWEFTSPHGIFEAMLKRKAFRFCPDLGWIYKAGRPVTDVLDRIGDRIGAVHFKDFAALEPRMNTVILGDGAAPLAECAQWITAHMTDPVWIIAEQDRSDKAAAETARRNAAFLKNRFQGDD